MKATTPSHSLESSFLRVARAKEHLVDLGERLDILTKKYRNAFIPQLDPNPPHDIIIRSRIGKRPAIPVPPEIAILIGEACYNFRCALDYLIYALAFLNTNKRPSGTQFPIEGKRERFNAKRDTYLKGVSDAHVTIVEGLQPYEGCKWIANLRDFSDFDKHNRFVNIKSRVIIIPGSVEGTTTHVFRTPRRPPEQHMKMKSSVTVEILFGKGTAIAQTLKEIEAGVAETLKTFKPEFER